MEMCFQWYLIALGYAKEKVSCVGTHSTQQLKQMHVSNYANSGLAAIASLCDNTVSGE
jgi:hypothetical protein